MLGSPVFAAAFRNDLDGLIFPSRALYARKPIGVPFRSVVLPVYRRDITHCIWSRTRKWWSFRWRRGEKASEKKSRRASPALQVLRESLFSVSRAQLMAASLK